MKNLTKFVTRVCYNKGTTTETNVFLSMTSCFGKGYKL